MRIVFLLVIFFPASSAENPMLYTNGLLEYGVPVIDSGDHSEAYLFPKGEIYGDTDMGFMEVSSDCLVEIAQEVSFVE